ncbi:zinc finger BED domain-containing protein 6-like [Harpegnathos saltator]|uniref:zinc finger BED domain-containing protein 6-like n=1 Tax=Harpegnathos saltator TaxID=610380 RepID=UPI000DBED51B|nr:zinc finger BED domain-containing protein 6-like [Harpegnathos saltator]
MDAKYTLISSDLKNSFNNIDFFCLTSDVWTDPFTNKSYISLTSHCLNDICKTWNIPDDKILCIVTDNGCNIKHVIHTTFGYHRHLPCFAHCLNLVAQKSIASSVRFQTIVTKVKHIVTHFKHSVRVSDELIRLQMLQGKTEGTCLKLKRDCPTGLSLKFHFLYAK